MHPHLFPLFLITFSSFILFAGTTLAPQDAEDQPELTCDFDTHDEWKEFVSFRHPAKFADKIQNSFVSSLRSISLTVNADRVFPEAQTSPHTLGSRSDHFQRGLEALLSEETSRIIWSFDTIINSTITLGRAFHDVLDTVPSNEAPLNPLLKKVASFVAIARDDFRARFPLPAMAPGHAERAKYLSAVLDHLQQLVIPLAKNREVEQEVIERHLARAKPFLKDLGVFIGDVAELYPAAIEALVLNMSAMLLPEAVFLRSLVILYCLGPYVLGKDAISGWLLKHVSETWRI